MIKHVILFTTRLAVATLLTIVAYLIWWGAWYRLPCGCDEVIDLRRSRAETPHYITFCAGLASNAHGFPGHAYVVWNARSAPDFASSESAGFVPHYFQDQLKCLYEPVTGLLVNNASEGNLRCVESLTVIVNDETFEHTRQQRARWDAARFKAFSRDCISFTDSIAEAAGLAVPARNLDYAQDHIRSLKRLNCHH